MECPQPTGKSLEEGRNSVAWEQATLVRVNKHSPGPRVGEMSPFHCRQVKVRQGRDLHCMGKGGSCPNGVSSSTKSDIPSSHRRG